MSFDRANTTTMQVPQQATLPTQYQNQPTYQPTQMPSPGVATLPTNPNAGSPPTPTVLAPTDGAVLMAADYSPKSFVVFGEGTKIHKESIKALGGKYNGRLREKPGFPGGPAWIFPMGLKPQVFEFVGRVNGGAVPTQQGIPTQGPQAGLPTVVVPAKNNKFQSIRWKVFKPADGMRVTVKANGTELTGEVLQTETHRDIIDTVYINMGGTTSKLVICNGRWQVWGYMVDHSVFFGDKKPRGATSPGGPVNPTTIGTEDDIQDVYRDVAGI